MIWSLSGIIFCCCSFVFFLSHFNHHKILHWLLYLDGQICVSHNLYSCCSLYLGYFYDQLLILQISYVIFWRILFVSVCPSLIRFPFSVGFFSLNIVISVIEKWSQGIILFTYQQDHLNSWYNLRTYLNSCNKIILTLRTSWVNSLYSSLMLI